MNMPIHQNNIPRMRDHDTVGLDGVQYTGAELRRLLAQADQIRNQLWADVFAEHLRRDRVGGNPAAEANLAVRAYDGRHLPTKPEAA